MTYRMVFSVISEAFNSSINETIASMEETYFYKSNVL